MLTCFWFRSFIRNQELLSTLQNIKVVLKRNPCLFAYEQPSSLSRTLQIEPQAGVIATKSKQSFTVKMTPQAARPFKERLLVDLVGVRDGALELPITATCSVPRVRKQILFICGLHSCVTLT